jgi:hypothetical protein
MYSNAKAIALLRDLSDKLSKRLAYSGTSMNSVRTAFSAADANGAVWPYLAISENGNEAEGQPVVIIDCRNVDAVSKDIFGNGTDAYAPHIIRMGYELSGAAGTNPIPSHADLEAIKFESIKVGARWQLAELANGSAATDANVMAASPIADIDELYWPTKSV